jgi:hypothetical protein
VFRSHKHGLEDLMSEEPDSSDNTLTFAVSLSPDRDHFLRRACPSCGREFKTEADPAELQWALETQCRRMGVEIGEPTEDAPAARIRCPFCDHEDSGAEMHTDETVDYLKRFVYREYVLPQINNLFSGLEQSLGRGSRSTGGLFSISLSFKHSRALLPPRPFHGPEPADFKIVEFLCCGKRIKVPENFNDVRNCAFCGTGVVLL